MAKCVVCGKELDIRQYRSKRYCSEECLCKDYNKKYYERNKDKLRQKHREYNKKYYQEKRRNK